MRIIVITDLHANLPALEAVLAVVSTEGYDLLVHTGDAIAIGPHSPECLDLLLKTPTVRCVVGNHEAFYVDGLPDPLPAWMDEGEFAHQQWVHRQLGDQRRDLLRKKMSGGVALIPGNQESPMNYPDNTYHFRQDSTFLYFFGLDLPGLVGVIDLDEDKDYIFGDDVDIEDVIWMGPQMPLKEKAKLDAVARQAREKGIQVDENDTQ